MAKETFFEQSLLNVFEGIWSWKDTPALDHKSMVSRQKGPTRHA